jgi:branched-chain amino acid transport system substrate-binding protein
MTTTGITRRRFGALLGTALAAPRPDRHRPSGRRRTPSRSAISGRSPARWASSARDGYLVERSAPIWRAASMSAARPMNVEIITADTQSDPVRASQITRDMINSKRPT